MSRAPQSPKTRRFTVRLPADLLDRLCYRAAAEGWPPSVLLREDLRRANERWRPPPPSTSGLTLVWPPDVPPETRVTPCVTGPDTERGTDTP